MTNSQINLSPEAEDDISLLYIINFLRDSWKKLALATIMGGVLGLSSSFFLGTYSAEYVLLNNNNSYGLNLVSWKALQKSLHNLVAKINDEGKAPSNEAQVFKALASEVWWQNNIQPSYAISKADIKELDLIGKDIDQASSTIVSFTLEMTGSSEAAAIDNVKAAANFMRTGSAYLQLRNLIYGYEGDVISSQADIQKMITSAEIEMSFHIQRAKNLEELNKRFPNNSSTSNLVVDAKDSGAKYLSIPTQIVAVNNDINQFKENLQRYRDRLAQITVIKAFIKKAVPLVSQTFDGLILGEQLLEVEQQVRLELAKDDIKNARSS